MKKFWVDIIIVNWNAGNLLSDSVKAIFESTYQFFNVHIIDNGSTDYSCDELLVNKRLHIHYMNKNLGFGKACNEALKYTVGEYILLLNPDTRIRPHTLETSINFLNSVHECKVYGCAQINNAGDVLKNTVGRFPNVYTFCNDVLGLSNILPHLFKNGFICTDWSYSESRYVNHVMGSFYLIRKSWINKYGFMDDKYFVYLEDLDLSLRVIKSGGKIYYDHTNQIYHKQGGLSEKVKAKRLFYSLHAKYQFIKKYFSVPSFILCSIIMLIPGFLCRILYSIILERSFKVLSESVKGYLLLYQYLFSKRSSL